MARRRPTRCCSRRTSPRPWCARACPSARPTRRRPDRRAIASKDGIDLARLCPRRPCAVSTRRSLRALTELLDLERSLAAADADRGHRARSRRTGPRSGAKRLRSRGRPARRRSRKTDDASPRRGLARGRDRDGGPRRGVVRALRSARPVPGRSRRAGRGEPAKRRPTEHRADPRATRPTTSRVEPRPAPPPPREQPAMTDSTPRRCRPARERAAPALHQDARRRETISSCSTASAIGCPAISPGSRARHRRSPFRHRLRPDPGRPRSSAQADFRMEIYNADGSQVEMCANGIRAFYKYLRDHGHTDARRDRRRDAVRRGATALGGRRPGHRRHGAPDPRPRQDPDHSRDRGERRDPCSTSRSTSPPRSRRMDRGGSCCRRSRWAIRTRDRGRRRRRRAGRSARRPHSSTTSAFPNRVNVEFIQIMSPIRIRQRTWERGTGETLACGSGACAVAVASMLRGVIDRRVLIELRGGELEIEWASKTPIVFMTGPAADRLHGRLIPCTTTRLWRASACSKASITALITPFRNGAVDETALRDTDRASDRGRRRRRRALRLDRRVGDALAPRAPAASSRSSSRRPRGASPVIAGHGLELDPRGHRADAATRSEAGADGALLLSPYYNKPTQEGIYRALCGDRAGEPLSAGRLQHPRSHGVEHRARDHRVASRSSSTSSGSRKRAGDLDQIAHVVAECPADFAVLSGDDGARRCRCSRSAGRVSSRPPRTWPRTRCARSVRRVQAGRRRARPARSITRCCRSSTCSSARRIRSRSRPPRRALGLLRRRDPTAPDTAHRAEPRATARGAQGSRSPRREARRFSSSVRPGRMGEQVRRCGRASTRISRLRPRSRPPGHPRIGEEIEPGIVLGSDVKRGSRRLSTSRSTSRFPPPTLRDLRAAAEAGVAYVTGTTGLRTPTRNREIAEIAERIPCPRAPTSRCRSTCSAHLAREAARLLGERLRRRALRAAPRCEARRTERHRAPSRPRPSTRGGAGRSTSTWCSSARARPARARRTPIGIQTLRGGDNPGEHTIYFVGTRRAHRAHAPLGDPRPFRERGRANGRLAHRQAAWPVPDRIGVRPGLNARPHGTRPDPNSADCELGAGEARPHSSPARSELGRLRTGGGLRPPPVRRHASKYSSNSCGCGRSRTGSHSVSRLYSIHVSRASRVKTSPFSRKS